MKLMRDIRLKERQIAQARIALAQSADELQRVLQERLASRTALALGFAGGLLAGWSRGRRRRAARRMTPARERVRGVTKQAKESLPPHWLGSYLVWPFVLATARDLMVARRPTSRREGEGISNRR
ncbi:MAG TPA: hypothetical protein VF203_13665 [Burkholderiales bacterium]